MNTAIEQLAAIALEDGGISLPLRLLASKKRYIRVTMYIPTYQSLVRISRKYAEIGITRKELDTYTFEQKAELVAKHGKTVSRMVAYGIVRGTVMGRLLNRPVAWMLRNYMHPVAMEEAWMQILSVLNTRNFENIIRSAEVINQLTPIVSQNGKRS